MEIDVYGYNPNSIDHALASEFYGTCSIAYNDPPSEEGPPPPPSGPQWFSIESPNDSAEEDISTGDMYLDSSDLEIMHDGADSEQVVGIVFPSVQVKSSDTILGAKVVFMVDEVRPGQSDQDVTVNVYGELAANSAAPSSNSGDMTSRIPTNAAVVWSITNPSATVGDALETPDITEVVKEILTQSGWSAGNSMGILFGHISGSGVRWVEAAMETDGGVLTPVLWINLGGGAACTGGGQGTASIGNPLDSAEEDILAGTMYLDSSDLELMHDGADSKQVVGIVFPQVRPAPWATLSFYTVIDVHSLGIYAVILCHCHFQSK
jgi:hypothetical protein